MASKKDLVEAHSYNRRRLVTAFSAGAPDGREVEPSHPGRAVVAGLVLAGMVVGAAALTGVVKPSVKPGWNDNALVVARSTGARYFAQKTKLYPVINTASARLLVPAGQFKVTFAPEDVIAKSQQGGTIGILGAPDALPRPQDLVNTGWTSCADGATGTSLQIGGAQAADITPNTARAVQVGKDVSIVSGRFRYAVKDPTVLRQLRLDAPPLTVAPSWLNLFTPGDDLYPLRPTAATSSALKALGGKVGQLVEVRTSTGTSHYLANATTLTPVSDFVAALYEGAPLGPLTPAQINGIENTLPLKNTWPKEVPALFTSDVACVVLTADGRSLPQTWLAQPRARAYQKPVVGGTILVAPGHGALVRAVSGGVVNAGQVYLVDANGIAYALGTGDEQARLGYADLVPSAIPPSWIAVLGSTGVVLSETAAGAQLPTNVATVTAAK